MKKILLTLMMVVGIASAAWAQVDDVTLVVSGEGATKDEATSKALRSAIEQAFGVFVSANTEILNDELVKDDIATVSSGNIKSYKELGSTTKDNGNIEVSLQAVVSTRNLAAYTQSHGAQTEFAGATYAANMKLVELNRKNTQKALTDLKKQLEELEKDLIDCEIETGIPQENGTMSVTLSYYANQNIENFYTILIGTLRALSIPESMHSSIYSQGIKTYKYTITQNRYSENIMLYYPIEELKLNKEWGKYNYYIVDNLGKKYTPELSRIVHNRILPLNVPKPMLKHKVPGRCLVRTEYGTITFDKATIDKVTGFEVKKR